MTWRKRVSLATLALIVIVGAGLGGSYAYMYQRVQQDVDAVFKRIFINKTTHYNAFWYLPWNGTIIIDDLSIGLENPTQIKKIVVVKPERATMRALADDGATSTENDNDYLPVAGEIIIEGVLCPNGSRFEQFRLGGFDVRLSTFLWPDAGFSKGFLSGLAQAFRFHSMSLRGGRVPIDAAGRYVVINLKDAAYSGELEHRLERLSLSGIDLQIIDKEGTDSETRFAIESFVLENMDSGWLSENIEDRPIVTPIPGAMNAFAKDVNAGLIALRGFNVRHEEKKTGKSAEGGWKGLEIKGMADGVLASFVFEGVSVDTRRYENDPMFFTLGKIVAEKIDFNASVPAWFTARTFSPLWMPDNSMGDIIRLMSIVRYGLVPFPVERLHVEDFDLDLVETVRINVDELSLDKTYRDGLLVEDGSSVRSVRIVPRKKLIADAWQGLAELGYDSLDFAFNHKESFTPDGGRLVLQTDIAEKAMGGLSVSVDILNYPRPDVGDEPPSLQAMATMVNEMSQVVVREARLHVENRSLIERLRMSNRKFATMKKDLQKMIDQGPLLASQRPLLVAVLSFLTDAGTLDIVSTPPQPIEIGDFRALMRGNEDVVLRLGLSVTATPPTVFP